jgi:O-antigen ligase
MAQQTGQSRAAPALGASSGMAWRRFCGLLTATPLVFILISLLSFSSGYVAYGVIVFAAVAAVRPMWGWTLFILILPLFGNNPGGTMFQRTIGEQAVSSGPLYFIDLALIVLVLRWLAGFWSAKAARKDPFPFAWLVALFWIVSALSLVINWRYIRAEWLWDPRPAIFLQRIYTSYATQGIFMLRALLDLTLAILGAMALRGALRDWRDVRRLIGALILSAVAVVLIGLAEYWGFIDLLGLRPPNQGTFDWGMRPLQSIFWHRGWLAEFIALAAAPAMALVLFAWSKKKALLLMCVALLGYGTLLTLARGGWLAMAALIVFLLALRGMDYISNWRVYRKQALALAVGAAVCAVGFAGILYALPEDNQVRRRLQVALAYQHRTFLWGASLEMARDTPTIGAGLGHYYQAHLRMFPGGTHFGKSIPNQWKATAHSTPLHLLAERGPLGLGFFTLLLAMIVWKGLVAARRLPRHDGRRAYLAGLLGLMAAFAAYGFVQYMFYIRIIEILFWLAVGMAGFLCQDCAPGGAARGPGRRNALAIAGLALIAACHAAGWKEVLPGMKLYEEPGLWRVHQLSWKETVELSGPVIATDIHIAHRDIDRNPVRLDLRFDGEMIDCRMFDAPYTGPYALYAPDLAGRRGDLELSVDRTWFAYEPYGVPLAFDEMGFAAYGGWHGRELAPGESIGVIRREGGGIQELAARSAFWLESRGERLRGNAELLEDAAWDSGLLSIWAPGEKRPAAQTRLAKGQAADFDFLLASGNGEAFPLGVVFRPDPDQAPNALAPGRSVVRIRLSGVDGAGANVIY